MARAVIYARYSSSGQREESIEDQVRVCTEEAARNGDEVLRVYADRAATGTEAEHRAQFQRMVADSAKGAFSLVYVYKTDRFARNRYDSATYKAKLKKNGVRVVSATERIADGADGILMEAVLEGFAEYYSAQLGENVRRGLHGNALKCKHNGVVVYGYDCGDDGLYHVNDAEAAVVRGMFEMYDGGAGMPEICERYACARNSRGKAPTMQTVSKMLRNERYAGLYRYGGVEVDGGMPQIVDRDLFDRVQRRLALRTRKRRGTVDYLLSGILFDAEGNRYQSSSGHGKTGRKYCYYRCPATGHNVPKDELEAEVASVVRAALGDEGAVAAIADLVLAEQDEALCDDLAAMDAARERIAANSREQDRLVALAAKTGATDAIARKLDDLAAEAAALGRDLAELEKGTPVLDRAMVEFWVSQVAAGDDVGQTVRAFVRRVVIDRDAGELRVEFTFDGGGDDGGGEGTNPRPDGPGGGSRNSRMAESWGFEPQIPFWGILA